MGIKAKGSGLWNAAVEGFKKGAGGRLSKNERNMKKFQAKKERGPVKTLFHITRNENVDNIMNQGLQANPAGKVNENSAAHPFANVGVDEGGVWVTNSPNVFPVYGTTVGSVRGPRSGALSTIRIDVPKEHLPNMTAVYNPYGMDSKLIEASDPNLFADFQAFNGMPAPTTAILSDMKPEWLTNLGYVEHHLQPRVSKEYAKQATNVDRTDNLVFGLDKGTLKDLSGTTGHRIPDMAGRLTKSPQRYAIDFIEHNQPISKRRDIFPVEESPTLMSFRQGNKSGLLEDMAGRPLDSEQKRYSLNFIPAYKWTDEYRPYMPYGTKVPQTRQSVDFVPGAISRGIGGNLPPIRDRNFDWKKYKSAINQGLTPHDAAIWGNPQYLLDWDNIVHHNVRGYGPKIRSTGGADISAYGVISRAPDVQNPFKSFITGESLEPDDGSLKTLGDWIKLDPKHYAEALQELYPDITRKTISDMNNPTWQEVLRAYIKRRGGYDSDFIY